MQYYCIHHKPSKDRKLFIHKNINLRNIKWVTEYLPSSEFIINHPKIYSEHSANQNYLSLAELSCYYKHLLAISMINESQEYGFIFEDDIDKPEFELKKTLNIFLTLMKENNTDILFVGSFGNYDLKLDEIQVYCNPLTNSRCAHAYIISPIKVKTIIKYITNIKSPLDWQLNYAIQDLQLKSCWSYPHIYQRTEKKQIPSLLR